MKRFLISFAVIFSVVTFCIMFFWISKFNAPEYIEKLVVICIYFWIYVLIGLLFNYIDTIAKDIETYHNLTRKCACLYELVKTNENVLKKEQSLLNYEEVIIVYTICDLYNNYKGLCNQAEIYNSKCNTFFRKIFTRRFSSNEHFSAFHRANCWYEEYGNKTPKFPELDKYHILNIKYKLYDIHNIL